MTFRHETTPMHCAYSADGSLVSVVIDESTAGDAADELTRVLDTQGLKGLCLLLTGHAIATNVSEQLSDVVRYAPLPVVAAIDDACLEGTWRLAEACHFRVVSRGTQVGSAGAAGVLSADEALEHGLADMVADDGRARDAAMALLETLVSRRTAEVVRAAMNSIHNASRYERAEALARESRIFCALVRSALETR
jgi:enoyl-CoA hydratase/carnithine racemase